MIALALACNPELIIGDEPTTALDVMMQAQILELLERLRADFGLSMILITHDLSVLAETCDRVAIMYGGEIAETGSIADVFGQPHHPYTRRLLGAFPTVGGPRELAPAIPGIPPDPTSLPDGCRFAPRCHAAQADCVRDRVPMHPVSDTARPRVPLRALAGRRAAVSAVAAPTTLFDVRGLKVHFPVRGTRGRIAVRALDGVDLEWSRGEVLGIVGESGCGKSTLGRTLMGLQPPTEGEVRFEGSLLAAVGDAAAQAPHPDGLPGSRTSRSTRA